MEMTFTYLSEKENNIFKDFCDNMLYKDPLTYCFKNFAQGCVHSPIEPILMKINKHLLTDCNNWFNLYLTIEDNIHTIVQNRELGK